MAKRINITSRYLRQWLTDEFKRLEIDAEVNDCYCTRFAQHNYEAGAAHYILKFGNHPSISHCIYVFYPRWYLNKELNNGYSLYLRLKDGRFLNDAQIDIRKTN